MPYMGIFWFSASFYCAGSQIVLFFYTNLIMLNHIISDHVTFSLPFTSKTYLSE